MIRLRVVQSVRSRIAATDERSDQVKPGELEVPKIQVSDNRQRSSSVGTGLAFTRGVYEVGAPSCCQSRPAGGQIWNAEAAAPAHFAPAGEKKAAKCPICKGSTSQLTGGACIDCRVDMDAAMDAQMKRLAEDREFQREMEEAAEDLPVRTKRCPSCGAEHSRPFTDLCGAERCDLWALDGKYRRWNAELEQSIKESMHG